MEKAFFSGEFEQRDKWKMGLLKADNCEYLMAAIYSVTVGITVQSKVILP